MKKKIVIIGGGAAGIMCALTLSKQNNTTIDIIILERQDRIGKKLLMTGNGKCNLTNQYVQPTNYNHIDFMEQVLPLFDYEKAKRYFYDLGLLIKTDEAGRAYPYSESAKSFMDLLLKHLQERKIEIHCGKTVDQILPNQTQYKVFTQDNSSYVADYIVLATGGKGSIPFNHNGFDIARALDLQVTKMYPALCPLQVVEETISLNNLRIKCNATLMQGNEIIIQKSGEVLFKDTGLSGILSLEMSLAYQRLKNKENIKLVLDLAPDFCTEDFKEFLKNKVKTNLLDIDILSGVFHKMIAYEIWKRSDQTIEGIVQSIKNFTFSVVGTNDFKQAQVTVGGIKIEEIDIHFEAKKYPNLYIIGEALDIDGDTGGFNLHFAWLSGYLCATHILKDLIN